MDHTVRLGLNHAVVAFAFAALVMAPATMLRPGLARAATSPGNDVVVCRSLTGVRWTVQTGAHRRVTGRMYVVKQTGIGCPGALLLAPAMIRQKGGPAGGSLVAPPGYRCVLSVASRTANAVAGVCSRAGGRAFSWAPKLT